MQNTVEQRLAQAVALGPGDPLSYQARLTKHLVRAFMKAPFQYGPATDTWLIVIQRAANLMRYATRVPRWVQITSDGFRDSEWVRAGRTDEKRVFLYLHGGGYFYGSPRLNRHFTWRMSAATGRPVLAAGYRLVPRYTLADALQDALASYTGLLDQGYAPENIVVCGDSSGGHLVLSLLLAVKDQGGPLPRAAILMSPWVDLLCTSESGIVNKDSDAFLPAEKMAWLGRKYSAGKKHDDPVHAPLHGDLTGLPPMMVIASGTEIARDDARLLAARAREAGVEVLHQEWPDLFHAFPMFAEFVPESKAAVRHMAAWLRHVEGGSHAAQPCQAD